MSSCDSSWLVTPRHKQRNACLTSRQPCRLGEWTVLLGSRLSGRIRRAATYTSWIVTSVNFCPACLRAKSLASRTAEYALHRCFWVHDPNDLALGDLLLGRRVHDGAPQLRHRERRLQCEEFGGEVDDLRRGHAGTAHRNDRTSRGQALDFGSVGVHVDLAIAGEWRLVA